MPDPSPLSWRDVYKAVGESETRIIAALNTTVEPLARSTADHELRLRVVEVGSSQMNLTAATVAQQELRLTALEHRESREAGVWTTLSAGKALVLALALIASPIVATVSLIVSLT